MGKWFKKSELGLKMKNKIIILIIALLLLVSLVVADNEYFDDFNMNENSIYNITNVNASAFYDNGVLLVDTDTTYSDGNGISESSEVFSVAGGDGLTQEASGLKVTADGIGDTQLEYDTGQALTTTSNPTFNNVTITDCIIFSSGGAICSGT